MTKKFCGNCGVVVEDGLMFCGNCGAKLPQETEADKTKNTVSEEKPVFEEHEEKTPTLVYRGDNENKLNPKVERKKGLILIAVFIIVTALISLYIINAYVGYEKVLEKTVSCIKKDKAKGLTSKSSKLTFYMMDYEKDELTEYYENTIGDILVRFENSVGNKYKLKYEITDIAVINGEQLAAFIDSVETRYPDYKAGSIKSIVYLEVRLTAKKGDREDRNVVEIGMIKEGGSWKLLDID